MSPDEIKKIFEKKKYALGDSDFYSAIFSHLAWQRKKSLDDNLLERICTEEYNTLSKRLDTSGVQESVSVRNLFITRNIATYLVNDEGGINYPLLPDLIEMMGRSLYSTGPGRDVDAVRRCAIIEMLKKIEEDKELRSLLNRIVKPQGNKVSDGMIRDTLQLPSKTSVTDAHAKRAVLSSLFAYLRQTVGSCFATAPAIIVHEEQPKQFLRDMSDLLNTGMLKRTFGGIEYTVPLSYSWGAGDLKKRFQLYREIDQNPLKLWNSPGLIAALEAVGLIDSSLSLVEKRDRLKGYIETFLLREAKSVKVIVTTTEELLRSILIEHHQLTESMIEEYLNRPQPMVHSSLLLSIPRGKNKEGKKKDFVQFFEDLETANISFKALADNALLKAWEFTLASFTEVKANFSKWNLYSSLGLAAGDPGGIGDCLYRTLKEKLDECNREQERLQGEYEQVYGQLKFVEGRLKRASSEKEAKWMRAEYQSRLNEFRTFEEMKGKVRWKAESLANLFDVLIDMYLQLFPEYFQEVYDADMHQVSAGQYDDSPAGFQLIYKHGRKNPSQWTVIGSAQEFIQSLTSFFVVTETHIVHDPVMKGIEEELVEIISRIIGHVKSEEFLESAFHRMAKAHGSPMIKDPLNNLDKIEKKPWSYTSGGSMKTLIACYFRREQEPTVQSRWVEIPAELLVFLIDAMKQLPPAEVESFKADRGKSMLMNSPTHAFLFKPGSESLMEGWESDAYTYTWVRDQLIKPRMNFVNFNLRLDREMIDYLIEKMMERIPENDKDPFHNAFTPRPRRMSSVNFREFVLSTLSSEKHLAYIEKFILNPNAIDALLYEHLPLMYTESLTEKMEEVFDLLEAPFSKEAFIRTYQSIREASSPKRVIGANEFRNLIKAVICALLKTTFSTYDLHLKVDSAVQKLGFAMPKPIIFADSNWVKELFGFLVNPGTGELDLWIVNATGIYGEPLSHWRKWLDGSRKEREWGLYPKVYEYTFS